MSAVKPNDTGYHWGYPKSIEEGVNCAYPNCRSGKVFKDKGHVIWDGSLDLNVMFAQVAPIIKFAMKEHLPPHEIEGNYIRWPFILHAECAAEWGIQLISDALKANPQVGRVLSHRGKIE